MAFISVRPKTACSDPRPRIHRAEVLIEVVQRSGRSDIDSQFEQGVTTGSRLTRNRHRERRPALVLAEDERSDRVGARWRDARAEHEPLGRHDFAVNACEGMMRTLWPLVNESKSAVRPQVDFTDCERHVTGIPPLSNMLGFRPGVEDNGPRRIEHPRDDDLAVRLGRDRCTPALLNRCGLAIVLCAHGVSPSSVADSGSRPDWRTFDPRSVDTTPATHRCS